MQYIYNLYSKPRHTDKASFTYTEFCKSALRPSNFHEISGTCQFGMENLK